MCHPRSPTDQILMELLPEVSTESQSRTVSSSPCSSAVAERLWGGHFVRRTVASSSPLWSWSHFLATLQTQLMAVLGTGDCNGLWSEEGRVSHCPSLLTKRTLQRTQPCSNSCAAPNPKDRGLVSRTIPNAQCAGGRRHHTATVRLLAPQRTDDQTDEELMPSHLPGCRGEIIHISQALHKTDFFSSEACQEECIACIAGSLISAQDTRDGSNH